MSGKLKKRTFVVLCFVIIFITGTYFLLRPTFTYKQIKLSECPNTYITQIEYWKIGERGLVFVKGKYIDGGIPNSRYVINPEMSGFDAIFQIVITCRNGRVVVNYYDGYYEENGPGDSISKRQVSVREFNKLRSEAGSVYLEGY